MLAYAFDQRYKDLGWKRRFRFWQLDLEKAKIVAGEKESAEWLNSALRKFYPVYAPGIADTVEASIIAAIESAMPVPPNGITGVSVQVRVGEVSFLWNLLKWKIVCIGRRSRREPA
jgi:hypothetical protein